jgi:hypothetical protein
MSDDPAVQLEAPYGGKGSAAQQLKRPGTVVAAAVLTWVSVVVTTFGTLAVLYFVLVMGPLFDLLYLGEIVRWYAPRVAIAVVVCCCLAAGLATQVMRGRNWARIALAGSAALVVVLSALAMRELRSIEPVATLLAAVVVIVLLFTGGANEWFRSAQSRTGTPALGHNHGHA